MMNKENVVNEYKKGNVTLQIVYDINATNPREFYNIGKMACWSKSYDLGDKKPECSPGEFLRQLAYNVTCMPKEKITDKVISELLKEHYVILPLFAYLHGDIAISTKPFTCKWDSGQIGYIYALKQEFINETGYTEEELFNEGKAEEMLKEEVKTYNDYLTGNVYGYYITEEKTCETCNHKHETVLEACCGFYGDDPYRSGMYEDISKEYRYLIDDKK